MAEHSAWRIRPAETGDGEAIQRIYAYYVRETTISFELEAPDVAYKTAEISEIVQRGVYLVAEIDGKVVGYAYAKPWHTRPAYGFTFESSIYLAHDRDRVSCRGLGRALYQQLMEALSARGDVHVLLGILTEGNAASERLHETLGFTHLASLPEVGYKFGRWLGVSYYGYYFPKPEIMRQP